MWMCYRNGADRLKVIRLVLWDRSHSLERAALAVLCHVVTAVVWHGNIINLTYERVRTLVFIYRDGGFDRKLETVWIETAV